MTERRARRGVAGVVVAVVLLAACGSSSKPTASNSTSTVASGGTNQTCQALDDFKSSLNSLKDQATLSGGKEGAQAALDAAQSDFDKLKSELKSADKPEVDALQSSLDDLKAAVQDLNGLSGLNNVIDAAQKVGTDAESLYRAMRAGCPSS